VISAQREPGQSASVAQSPDCPKPLVVPDAPELAPVELAPVEPAPVEPAPVEPAPVLADAPLLDPLVPVLAPVEPVSAALPLEPVVLSALGWLQPTRTHTAARASRQVRIMKPPDEASYVIDGGAWRVRSALRAAVPPRHRCRACASDSQRDAARSSCERKKSRRLVHLRQRWRSACLS